MRVCVRVSQKSCTKDKKAIFVQRASVHVLHEVGVCVRGITFQKHKRQTALSSCLYSTYSTVCVCVRLQALLYAHERARTFGVELCGEEEQGEDMRKQITEEADVPLGCVSLALVPTLRQGHVTARMHARAHTRREKWGPLDRLQVNQSHGT